LGITLLEGLDVKLDAARAALTFVGRVDPSCVAGVLAHLPLAAERHVIVGLVQHVELDAAALSQVLHGEVDPIDAFNVGSAALVLQVVADIPALVGESPSLVLEAVASLGVLSELSEVGLTDALEVAEASLAVMTSEALEPVFYQGRLGRLLGSLAAVLEDAAGLAQTTRFQARAPAAARLPV
jgi:hypothetical protein